MKELEFIAKKLSTKNKLQEQMASLVNFNMHLKKKYYQFYTK